MSNNSHCKNVSIYLGEKDTDLIKWLNENPHFNASNFFKDKLRDRLYGNKTISPVFQLNCVIGILLGLAALIAGWGLSFVNDVIRFGMISVGFCVIISVFIIFRRFKSEVTVNE